MLLCLPTLVLGASMNIHSIVGHRAQAYYAGIANGTAGVPSSIAAVFDSLLLEHKDATLAGADFPDFLYACGSYADHHDAGEAAHWPPFHAAAVRYLLGLQPDPTKWSDDQRELAAFTFGLATHYVADELWEGLTSQLGAKRGFTEMVDAFQLGNDGHGNVAEGVSNMGADFFAAWALDESNISAWRRRFPLEHMVQIYHSTPKDGVFRPNSTNFTDVTLASLAECSVLFDLGLWALQSFGPLLYEVYNDGPLHKLPFIEERLFDAPLAGVDDMAAMVTFAWQRLARWYVDPKGPPLAPPKKSTAALRAKAAADDADDRSTHALLLRLRPFVGVADARLRHVPISDARRFFAVPTARRGGGSEVALRYDGPPDLRKDLEGIVRSLAAHFLGEGATILVSSGDDDGGPDALEERPPAHRSSALQASWSGDAAQALLGTQLASGDFDGDGEVELVLCEAGAGERGVSPRAGACRLTSGGGGTEQPLLRGGGALSRFGSAVAVLDFNLDGIDDLAVGAPGYSGWNVSDEAATPFPFSGEPTYRSFGRLYVYLGARGHGLSADRVIVLSTAQPFTGLGTVLAVEDVTGDGHADLLLGCPSAFDYDGRVLAVSASASRIPGTSLSIDSPGTSALDIRGEAPRGQGTGFGWFGASLALSGSQLLVGSPYHRRDPSCTKSCAIVGRVFGFDVGKSHPASRNASAARFTVTGSSALGMLGGALAATTSVAAIAAPDVAGRSTADGRELARAGAVALVDTATLAGLSGDVSFDALPRRATIRGIDAHARLGSTMLLSPAAAESGGDDQLQLALAAPFHGGGGVFGPTFAQRELGALYVWTQLPTGNVTTSSAAWHVIGARARGRFGTALAVWTNGSLAVGAPRATVAGREQSGAVDVVGMAHGSVSEAGV